MGKFFDCEDQEVVKNLNGNGYSSRDFSRVKFCLGNNYEGFGLILPGQNIYISRFREVPVAHVLEGKTRDHIVFTFSRDFNLEKIAKVLEITSASASEMDIFARKKRKNSWFDIGRFLGFRQQHF